MSFLTVLGGQEFQSRQRPVAPLPPITHPPHYQINHQGRNLAGCRAVVSGHLEIIPLNHSLEVHLASELKLLFSPRECYLKVWFKNGSCTAALFALDVFLEVYGLLDSPALGVLFVDLHIDVWTVVFLARVHNVFFLTVGAAVVRSLDIVFSVLGAGVLL